MQEEIWKDIPTFEGFYQVSNIGNVRGLDRPTFNPVNNTTKGITLKPSIKRGYKCVVLSFNGLKKYISIHRLVAITFIENTNNKPQVNHINGIKTDNRVDNLEWNTSKENINHAFRKKLIPSQNGSSNVKAILKEEDVIEIRRLEKNGLTRKELKLKYNVSKSTIDHIINRRTWLNI